MFLVIIVLSQTDLSATVVTITCDYLSGVCCVREVYLTECIQPGHFSYYYYYYLLFFMKALVSNIESCVHLLFRM